MNYLNTTICRDNPSEAVRMYDELMGKYIVLEQALEQIASNDVHHIDIARYIAKRELGRR